MLPLAIALFATSVAADLQSCLSDAGVAAVSTSSSNYADAAFAFNTRLQFTPAAVVQPTSEQQVASAVACGAQNNVAITSKSGSHGYVSNGIGGKNGALVVDLQKLNSFNYDSSNQQATVGPGLRLGQVVLQLSGQGRALSFGSCPLVGSGGHAAGGGFGLISRQYGLLADQVVAANVVTANGTLVTANADNQYSDLFWAIRGSAPSFGIVTSFTYQTFDAPTITTFVYNWNDQSTSVIGDIIMAYQDWGLKAPSAFTSTMDVVPTYKNDGKLSLDIHGGFVGSKDDLNNAMSSLLSAISTAPSKSSSTTGSWIDFANAMANNVDLNAQEATQKKDNAYVKSLLSSSSTLFTRAAVDSFTKYMAGTLSSSGLIWFGQIELYGGSESAINKVSYDTNSFGHRDSLFNFQLYASRNLGDTYSSTDIAKVQGWWDSLVQPMGSSYPVATYWNYPDSQLSQDQANSWYWGRQLPRLQSLKAKYDPQQVFNFPNAIQPASSPSSSISGPTSSVGSSTATQTRTDTQDVVSTSTSPPVPSQSTGGNGAAGLGVSVGMGLVALVAAWL